MLPVIRSLAALITAAMLTAACAAEPDHPANTEGAAPMAFGAGYLVETATPPESDSSVHYVMVETVDGLYAPVAIRIPKGEGPFAAVVFASGNGGDGLAWLGKAVDNHSWLQEEMTRRGYVTVWMRYRAEVDRAYHNFGPLVQDQRQGRQLLNRGPLEYEDEIAIIDYLKTLPWIDGARIAHIGVSHGGEMALKVTSEYHGLRAAVASEPASHEFLAMRPPQESTSINPDTLLQNLEQMRASEADKVRARVDIDTAMQRIATIDTPILVMGRENDHLQGIFRLTYDLLDEAGKDAEWVSYDHPEHGYIYPHRPYRVEGAEDEASSGGYVEGAYQVDDIQREAITAMLDWLEQKLQ
jgi:dienelactone hydrolase